MLLIHLIGNIGQPPKELRAKNGNSYASVSLACNTYSNGKKETTWVQVLFFGQQAEALLKAEVGAKLAVVGKPTVSAWVDKDGNPQAKMTVMCQMFEFVSAKAARAEAAAAGTASSTVEEITIENDEDDLVPF